MTLPGEGQGEEKGRRQALGRGLLGVEAALEPVEEGTAGHGRRAFVSLPVWGAFVSREQYELEKYAYERAVQQGLGDITTATLVELPPSGPIEIDLAQGDGVIQPSA